MKSRLRRRYGRALAEGFYGWRGHIELALTRRFEEAGVSYWTARDLAMDIVKKAKGLPKMHRQGVSATDAAAIMHPKGGT